MVTYFEILFLFLLIFALLCGLAYMPVITINKWAKANTVFPITVLLVFIFKRSEFSNLSYIFAFGFILVAFNLYLLLVSFINPRRKRLRIILDFIYCGLTLFASSCIIAYMDDIPIKPIIFETFSDGGYTFSPGYFYEMISNSLIFSAIIICFRYIYIYLIRKWKDVQKLRIYKIESEKKSIETQFEALQAKVNPHFLYNALNSIAGLATVDGVETREMSLALSNFFRYSMNREQQVMTTVENEIEMIKTYLKIEQIRFSDRLSYTINVSDDAAFYQMPRMLILPIVENSIKHGMRNDRTPLLIDISFTLNDTSLIISIKDNGVPFPKDIVISGFGIKSVYDKLDLLFPSKYSVELITIPQKEFRISLYNKAVE